MKPDSELLMPSVEQAESMTPEFMKSAGGKTC